MTTALIAAAPAGMTLLDGPPPLPRPYSLLESASAPEVMVVTDPRALAGGLAFWPYTNDTPMNWAPCEGTAGEKDLSFSNELFEQEPFTAYLPVGCSSIDATEDELRQRVLAVFTATESMAVERQLAIGEVQDTPRFLGDTHVGLLDGGTAEPPPVALALLEDRIAQRTGRRGIIHATPGTVSEWAPYLIDIGGVLRTVANGTLVVSGAGYIGAHASGGAAPTTTSAWAFATGPVMIVRGDVQVLFAWDHSVNDQVAIAERNYVIGWDGQLQSAALIDLTP